MNERSLKILYPPAIRSCETRPIGERLFKKVRLVSYLGWDFGGGKIPALTLAQSARQSFSDQSLEF